MFTNSKLAKSIRLAMAFGAASSAMVASNAAVAQEAAADEEAVEKIAVTGSRIRKAEFASNAPIATIGSEQFSLTATVNTESLLNTLPQVIPGLDRTSNNPGNGTATVDLRGLGVNRTLVLINGKRAVPTSSNGAVDINAIPTALIQDVEVLTGGASAVYGSDAVAGVVNFILKDDFEGVQASAGYEVTDESDAAIWSADLTIGGNFADGKGNVVFNMSFTDREELFQGDRDFSFFDLSDDGEGGIEPSGSPGVPDGHLFSFSGNWGGDFADGALFQSGGGVRPWVESGPNNDQYNFAPVNYIQLPQKRHQITALGKYELAENTEVYARAMFTDSRVPQQLAPTPWYQTVTFTLDQNPFLSDETIATLDPFIGNGDDVNNNGISDTATGFIGRRMEEVGARRSVDSFTSYQLQAGITGFIGDSNWSYDAYFQTGKVENVTAQQGNINRDRALQSLILARDENGDVILDADNNPSCADSGSNGGVGSCVPMNVFGAGNISPEAAAWVSTLVNSSALFEQDMMGISLSGDSEGFFELPGGPIGIALGWEKRDETFEFLPSQDLAAGTIAGFNSAPGLQGGYDTSELFVEMYLPIFEGESFAELWDVELAYRSADYSSIGTVSSYKIATSWAPVEEFRIRAGLNTAVRAPNIGELFSPQGEGFPGAEDPCSANGTIAQTDALRQLCIATGVPADRVFTSAMNTRSGQVRQIGGGNPNLKEEEAETLTVGFVYDVTEEISFSFDYFDIEIEDAIAGFGGGSANVLTNCYDTSVNTEGAASAFCGVINRFNTGPIDFIEILSQNVATQTLKGYDLIASYNTEMFDGNFSIDYLGTYTTESDFVAFAGDAPLECAGKFGNTCGEPVPEYKHRTTFKYSTDDFTTQLEWRYVGQVDTDVIAEDPADLPSVSEISGHSYFNLAGTYYINDNYKVTGGIDNLFDKKPPVIGSNDEQANTYPATYDVFGRTYYVNFTATF